MSFLTNNGVDLDATAASFVNALPKLDSIGNGSRSNCIVSSLRGNQSSKPCSRSASEWLWGRSSESLKIGPAFSSTQRNRSSVIGVYPFQLFMTVRTR